MECTDRREEKANIRVNDMLMKRTIFSSFRGNINLFFKDKLSKVRMEGRWNFNFIEIEKVTKVFPRRKNYLSGHN
jgi:hypothetical protein